MSIESVMDWPSHPLLSPFPPAFNHSQHQSLSNVEASGLCIRWPKYWSFNISPSNEYSGLISFRNDWFDLLAVQGTLKSLLQDHKWNESESRSVCLTHCNSPWNSLGQNTGVGSFSLLKGIFPTQGSHPGLPHHRRILYQLSHKGNPRILEWVMWR